MDGKVVGINIARGGRVKSYAITSKDLKQVIASLTSSNNEISEISSLQKELELINNEIIDIENKLLEIQKRKKAKQNELKRAMKTD